MLQTTSAKSNWNCFSQVRHVSKFLLMLYMALMSLSAVAQLAPVALNSDVTGTRVAMMSFHHSVGHASKFVSKTISFCCTS